MLFRSTNFQLKKNLIHIQQETNYPWSGLIKFTVHIPKKENAAIALRIPGWASNKAVPGDMYTFKNVGNERPSIKINGQIYDFEENNGYATINREWRDGDVIEYLLPMQTNKVIARSEVKQDRLRYALQRGPIIYCIEGADNDGDVWNLVAPIETNWKEQDYSILDEKVVSLVADLPVVKIDSALNKINTEHKTIRAIPYYTWCNRGSNPMQVWLPSTIEDVKINYR